MSKKNQKVPYKAPAIFPTRPTTPQRANSKGLVALSAPEVGESWTVSGAVDLAKKSISDTEKLDLEVVLEWLDFVEAVHSFNVEQEDK